MATQQEISFIPQEEWMSDIPTTGLILLKRFANTMVRDQKDRFATWGESSASGYLTITDRARGWNKRPVDGGNYMGSRLSIKAAMMALDLSNPDQRLMYGLLSKTDQFKGIISPSEKNRYHTSSNYYFENPEMEAIEWMKNKQSEVELMKSIDGLDPVSLKRMGLIFSIKGSEKVIQSNLYKKAETPNGRKALMEVIASPDRDLIELIAVAESQANPTAKTGLWKSSNSGIYHWNNISIGLETAAVISYLKKDTELQYEMKKLYFGGSEPQHHESAIKINKGETPEQKLMKELNPDSDVIIEKYKAASPADHKASMDTIKQLAVEHSKHWKTVQKILKDNGVELK